MPDLQQFVFVAAAGVAGEGPSVPTVVLTGISLVFAILVVLWLILLAQGKVFTLIDKRKAESGSGAVSEPVPPPGTAVAPVPAVGTGVEPHVVAAITAAVAAMEEGNYVVQSIEVAKEGLRPRVAAAAGGRRGQWGQAAVVSYTEPF